MWCRRRQLHETPEGLPTRQGYFPVDLDTHFFSFSSRITLVEKIDFGRGPDWPAVRVQGVHQSLEVGRRGRVGDLADGHPTEELPTVDQIAQPCHQWRDAASDH